MNLLNNGQPGLQAMLLALRIGHVIAALVILNLVGLTFAAYVIMRRK